MSHEGSNGFIPISWISKQDLRNARPDLAEQINGLDDNSLQIIAKNVGDALQETYRMALELALLSHLGINETTNDEFHSV